MSHIEQYYVEPRNVSKTSFYLEGGDFTHIVKVMRKRVGDKIVAVDGLGNRYTGEIKRIEKKHLDAEIQQKDRNICEPSVHLTLAQAVPKGSRFDMVVEKGTEIGISAFLPILTERSIPDPSNRSTRWQQKAIAAMKQSGRCRCPAILPPMQFNDAVDFYADSTEYIAHAYDSFSNKRKYLDTKANKDSIVLFVGPEGGFTENEVQYALAHHVEPIRLGIRRLRSETAGLVGAIKILSTAGEL